MLDIARVCIFIKLFTIEWKRYDSYRDFYRSLREKRPEDLKKIEENDRRIGIKPYKNRLDFALRNTRTLLRGWEQRYD